MHPDHLFSGSLFLSIQHLSTGRNPALRVRTYRLPLQLLQTLVQLAQGLCLRVIESSLADQRRWCWVLPIYLDTSIGPPISLVFL
jgi:hypothetical protein